MLEIEFQVLHANVFTGVSTVLVGLIQVLLVAGATECSIQQHCESERDGYNTLIIPCPCSKPKSTINIMWVRATGSTELNHIIPLLPENVDISE